MKALTTIPKRAMMTQPSPAAVYLASLSEGSYRTMLGALNKVAKLLHARDAFDTDWAQLEFRDTQAIRASLAEDLSPASVNKVLSALKGVLRATWKLGLIDNETFARVTDWKPIKGSRLPAGRMLSPGEVKRLYGACRQDKRRVSGIRDAAALALLASFGLRRSEVVGLDVSDYRDGMIVVRGKGDRERHAFGFNGSAKVLRQWLRVRGTDPGPLLCPVNRWGEVVNRRMGTQSLYDKLRLRGQQAGIESFSPHDLRRTYISTLLGKGIDLATVSRMAGHASPQTTMIYDLRPEETQRAAAASIDAEEGS